MSPHSLRNSARRTGRLHARPRLEALEPRRLLATFTVTGLADAGPGSLREMIERANLDSERDTIEFAPGVRGAIELTSALPDLSTAMILDGPGATVLTVARSGAAGTPAFRIFTVPDGAEVAISGLTITGGLGGRVTFGTLTRILGGGIANTGTLTVTNSTIVGNSAADFGGGINNLGTLTVTNSTISGNDAAVGGGISNGGRLTVTNSTIVGNSASFGGAIESGIITSYTSPAVSGRLTVTNSTIVGNSATGGGGFSIVGGTLTMLTVTGSLFSGNSGGSLAGSIAGSSLSHNLFSDAPDVALDRTSLINTDPLLGPLADHGGPTMTHALLPGSPAIDAAAPREGITTDQRGVPRPQGAAPDIGAFESRGFTLAVAGGGNQGTPALSPFPEPLVVAVASPAGEPVVGGRVTFLAPPAGAGAVLTGSPATIGAGGRASVTAGANATPGSYAITARASGAPDVRLDMTNTEPAGRIAPSLAGRIALSPAAGVGVVGQAHAVTATITTPEGAPLSGIPVTFQVVAGPNVGATGTTDPADRRTDASGQVRFVYAGAGGPGADTVVAAARLSDDVTIISPPVTVLWSAPTVIEVLRRGSRLRPARLVLTFDRPMGTARAEDRANYRLLAPGPDGRLGTRDDRPMPIASATYDAALRTVTLAPRRRSLHQSFRLTVKGTPPGGLTDTSGVFLDGAGAGLAGTDFVADFGRRGPAGRWSGDGGGPPG